MACTGINVRVLAQSKPRRRVADEVKGEGDMMQKIIAIIIASAFALLAGCNTVEGFGQDVKGAGKGIEKAADRAKPN